MRRLPVSDERGSVLALSAFTIPIFLVLVALVIDVGMWHTHKRQLQNRADAGALAAGVEYATRWAACGDPALKATAAGLIDAAARQYAGDPQQGGTLRNTELTEQTRINVEINSNQPRAEPNSSWNDAGGNNLGPCDKHPADSTFSTLPNAYYVDVGVRERDQPSLFGVFGLDLLRNEAYARVQLLTAAAGKGFLPIALADQNIQQAQIRYYRHCGPSSPVLIGQPITLRTLGSAYQNASGTTLWGPTLNDVDGGPPVGVDLALPVDKSCSPGPNNVYMPVRAQVRIAGVKAAVIDINNYTCAELQAMRYTDCWDQVSDISVDGDDPKSEPWFHEVTLTGGSSGSLCSPDAYFAKSPGVTSCSYGVSVTVDWNGLQNGGPAGRHCKVSVGGSTVDRPNCPNGIWSMSGTNSALGRSDVMLTWSCLQPDTTPPFKDVACPGTSLNTSLPVHSLFLGDRQNSGIMTLVRTSQNAQVTGGLPGPELHWYPAPQNGSQPPITVYPTVGLEGSLYVGQRRVLRAPHCKNGTNSDNCDIDTSSPNSSQSIDCEPGGGTGGQGHDFGMFAEGCSPWYGPNSFTDPDWYPCPDKSAMTTDPRFVPNTQGKPWRCVVKAPGFSPNVIADGIAAAIGNCSNIQSNSCQNYACNNYNYYNPAQPDRWALEGGEPSPRIGLIFIVPYGAYKGTASQETMPILSFAAFYITGWEGKGAGANQNPCLPGGPPGPPGSIPDENTNGGDIVGYFVDYTAADAPGDPNANCVIGQLQPCVPVLVR